MANEHLKLTPTTVTNDVWYYEETGGIGFWTGKGPVHKITWRKLRGMLKRKDKPSK